MSALSSHTDTSVYTDLHQFSALRNEAQTNPDAALEEVAKQFESVFINMLVKSMRAAGEPFASEFGNSNQIKAYQQMFDQQLSLSLASEGGLGLAEIIAKQLGAADNTAQTAATVTNSGISTVQSVDDITRFRAFENLAADTLTTAKIGDASSAEPLVDLSVAEGNVRPITDSTDTAQPLFDTDQSELASLVEVQDVEAEDDKWLPETPREFLESLWSLAKDAGEALQQNPKVILAQAALETGWGKFVAGNRDGSNSFNLFGIKSGSAWLGAETAVSTLEYEDGVAQRQVENFRSYESLADSFRDYVSLLTDNPRYEKALASKDDEGFVRGLQEGGYATDPNYADKILGILSKIEFDGLGQQDLSPSNSQKLNF